MMTTVTTEQKIRPVSFIEKTFTHKGKVLAVRSWNPATFYEVDLHLPEASGMGSWHKAQRINIRVAPFTFRDYTPAGWDAETRTCTLYIDAAHNGPGSRWVRSLKEGDAVTYFNIESAHQSMPPGIKPVFLGDQSSIGHFSALAQLAGPDTPIKGALALEAPAHHLQFFKSFYSLPLEQLSIRRSVQNSLSAWITTADFSDDHTFYLVGNAHMVTGLRKQLRGKGISSRNIKAQGFWH